MRAMGDTEFRDFFEILRSGDPEAVNRLLSELDPVLRRAIRLRLLDRRVRRIADTADIFQSLLKDFLGREAADGAAAASTSKLQAYVATAAHHKITSKLRKERRRVANLDDVAEPVSADSPAEKNVEDREMVDAIRGRLSEENRRLFDLSRQGQTWRQTANQIGGNPDTLRIQLRRSIVVALSEIRHGERICAK